MHPLTERVLKEMGFHFGWGKTLKLPRDWQLEYGKVRWRIRNAVDPSGKVRVVFRGTAYDSRFYSVSLLWNETSRTYEYPKPGFKMISLVS